jgi:hypothetical protein
VRTALCRIFHEYANVLKLNRIVFLKSLESLFIYNMNISYLILCTEHSVMIDVGKVSVFVTSFPEQVSR